MERAERQSLMARYKAGYDEVARALEGITAEELDFPPRLASGRRAR